MLLTDAGADAAGVSVAGELDIAATPELERALLESHVRARLVVLDLRELEFMDSCGVHAILGASIGLGKRAAGWLSCAAPRPSIECSGWPGTRMM